MAEEFDTIILTAILSTVGAALVAYFGHKLTVSRDAAAERERRAQYLAIKVVCCLDNFVTQCYEAAADEGIADVDGYYRPDSSQPELDLPTDVDWQSVAPRLMYRTLSLPNEIARADASIDWVANNIASPPDYDEFFEERMKRYSQIGLISLNLGKEYRIKFKIPELEQTKDWSIEEELRKLQSKVEARERDRVAQSARMTAEMNARAGDLPNSEPPPPRSEASKS